MASIRERTRKDGSRFYTVVVRIKGSPPMCQSFDRKTDARDWAQKTESDIKRGKTFPERAMMRLTVSDMLDQYRDTILPRRTTRTREEHILEWWEQEIGHLLLSHLNASVISACREKLIRTPARGKTPMASSTVQKYLIYFSHVCQYAYTEWQILNNNPARAVKKPSAENGRDRLLTDAETRKLLNACSRSPEPYLMGYFLLGLTCGCRSNEALSLKWSDVDFKRRMITLRKTKNKDIRSLPLCDEALAEMKKLYKNRTLGHDYVFAGEDGQPIYIRWWWYQAMETAGLDDFRYHDLRHCFATRLGESGASLLEIAQLLGHKTMQMVKRYSHLTERTTAKHADKVNRELFINISSQR